LEEPGKEEKLEVKERKPEKKSTTATTNLRSLDLARQSLPELNQMLQSLLEKEDYEQAIMVRDEISRRKKES
jgi:protein-arginine kinase activator protein McsA